MKKVYLLAIGTLMATATWAQKVATKDNVGIGTNSPDASAVLDIQSVNKGLLIPRLTVDQRNSITSPANGLMIYQTNEKSGFYFYDGNVWKPMSGETANSVATLDINGWALDGNASGSANKAVATATSHIGVPSGVPIKFKIAGVDAGTISQGNNIFMGFNSGTLTTGGYNTTFGYEALKSNVSGSNNLALGFWALKANVSGGDNIAIGRQALELNTSAGNIGIGYFALNKNNSGYRNIAIGYSPLSQHTNGTDNTAIGSYSLDAVTSGSSNMALGSFTGTDLATGTGNVFIGKETGFKITNGSNNTFIGTQAGYNTNSVPAISGNLFMGYQAGYNETLSNKLYISNSSSANPLIKGDFAGNYLQVNSKTTGYLAIGDFTTAPVASPAGTGGLPLPANIGVAGGYRLVVQDGILCEKVKVALRATGSTDWADYVFEPEYKNKMMSLEELEKFTIDNKHLPNVPTTAEVQKNGLDMHETSKLFLEKIEELTLYMIEMNKEIKALKAENEALKRK